MAREFKEEAGIDVTANLWSPICYAGDEETFELHVFASSVAQDEFNSIRSMTTETIYFCNPLNLPENALSNLRWLVPLALHRLRTPGDFPKTAAVRY